MIKHLLILGGGTAGTMMANPLRKRTPAPDWQMTVLDRSEKHLHQPGFLFLPHGKYAESDIIRQKHGIGQEQVHLHLVYHRTGIAAVVKDEARKRLGAEAANPNAEILAELVKRGVQVELCENTMQQKGVKPSELPPGVKLVVGALPRLIDLQLQGFAYIKFE